MLLNWQSQVQYWHLTWEMVPSFLELEVTCGKTPYGLALQGACPDKTGDPFLLEEYFFPGQEFEVSCGIPMETFAYPWREQFRSHTYQSRYFLSLLTLAVAVSVKYIHLVLFFSEKHYTLHGYFVVIVSNQYMLWLCLFTWTEYLVLFFSLTLKCFMPFGLKSPY